MGSKNTEIRYDVNISVNKKPAVTFSGTRIAMTSIALSLDGVAYIIKNRLLELLPSFGSSKIGPDHEITITVTVKEEDS